MSAVQKIELEILYEISRIANSTLDLKGRLDAIVSTTVSRLGRDACSVFLLDKDGTTLVLEATLGLNPAAVGKASFNVGEGVTGWVARHRKPLALGDAVADPRFKFLPETGVERFRSMLSAPILDGDNFIGVINLHTVEPWTYPPEEIMLVSTIANEVAGMIRAAQLYEDISRRFKELTVLDEIGQAMTSTLDLEALLKMIIRSSVAVLDAKGGIVRLLDDDQTLVLRSYYGAEEWIDRIRSAEKEELVVAAQVLEGRPLLLSNVRLAPGVSDPDRFPFESLLAVPIRSKDKIIGSISLYDKGSAPAGGARFTQDDLHLLCTISSQAGISLENAIIVEELAKLAEENRKRLLGLSALYDTSKAMLTTLELEKLLRIILAGVTMGGGLGFNRAVLLLADDRSNILRGVLGVGPDDPEEAGQIWRRMAGVRDITRWVITEEEFSEPKESRIDRAAKIVELPIREDQGVLALTLIHRKPYNVQNAEEDPAVDERCRALFGGNSFATVPLVVGDRAIGVIAVDNLYNRKIITDEDISFLLMLASQAALAIENARIHTSLEDANRELLRTEERLIQTEKLAALGEMAARVAHEIRNPLVSIGGFARRIQERLESAERVRKYSEIIASEVDRLEKILQEILAFSKESTARPVPADLNHLIRDAQDLFRDTLLARGIKVSAHLREGLPPLRLDPHQMKQVFINLFGNAEQAMENGGRLDIASDGPGPDGRVVVRIGNTGPSIPPDVMANIFNPFFTTKPGGTGLGLAIVHRIVTHHGGSIHVENRPEGGVTFILALPVLRSGI